MIGAVSAYCGVPAGGRSGGLVNFLLAPLGRTNPAVERVFVGYLFLTRPLDSGAGT